MDLVKIYEHQRANRWKVAQTSAKERIAKLRKLKDAIFARQEELHKAIYDDFRKNPGETDLTEVHLVVAEINDAIHHLPRWMRPHKVGTPLTLFGTRSEIRYEPKGLVLILSPWNYPFQLAMAPVVAAIAAGNCVILKPSAKTPATAAFLKRFLGDLFPEDEVVALEGDHTVADALLEFPFDHIFFTGSPPIGKKVMAAAARHLTPVTLELGGKSPVIVDDTADVKKAARRIMWGKYINAGQTCVAPDYLLIHESHEREFIEESKKVIASRYGETEKARSESADFCRLVSIQHAEGLKKALDESVRQGVRVEMGGESDTKGRYMSPTILSQVKDDSHIMKEEIFGPILPILTYRSLDDAIRLIRKREKPLALYIFSRSGANIEKILRQTTAGGSCVNNLMIHLANSNLPFGGIGQSGMGSYHGFFGFRTLSHERGVLRQGPIDTLKFFYPPYTLRVRKMISWLTKHLG